MSDPVTRLNSALQGRYAIERELGQGGMATVYLADDLKHERKVALKVLKPELAAVVGAERFLAEIKTTANLQHPHILPLHDSGEADGFLYYVMPYIEGETLRDRLEREKQLPVDEAVRIASDVAEALHAAHERGVIHRDVKPANILLSGGRPLVADFGIALAVSAAGGGRLTETGLSLGTPHYMSPEQATGDERLGPATDTYALGCVLYEMLIGEPPFTGSTPQAILGKIVLGRPASATAQRKSVPPNVDAAVRKALEKVPADRFNGTNALSEALAEPGFQHGTPVEAGGGGLSSPWHRLAIAMTASTFVLAAALGWSLISTTGDPEVRRQRIYPFPEAGALQPWTIRHGIGLSPDGSAMALADSARTGIYLKELDQAEGMLLSGTEGGGAPTFSPDGEWIAFFTDEALKKVPRKGGAAETLADGVATGFSSAAWLEDGTIVFNTLGWHLARVSEDGGEVEVLLEVSAAGGFVSRLSPLPDGRGVIYLTCNTNCVEHNIHAFDFETLERKLLIEDAVSAWHAPTGHLLYVRTDGGVFAAPFDLRSLEITGPAVPVFEGVSVARQYAAMHLAEDGTLVYLTGPPLSEGPFQVVKVDREGRMIPFDEEWFTNTSTLSLSPDGRLLAFDQESEGGQSIWVKELPDGPETRLTGDEPRNYRPFWSPDGRLVVYTTAESREGVRSRLASRRFDASAPAEPFLERGDPWVWQASWSRDGRWLVYRQGVTGGAGLSDLRYVEFGNDSTDKSLIQTEEFDEWAPALSPDARWIAYLSDQSGDPEVYVRPFPNVEDAQIKISDGGGFEPAWARSGQELFYRDGEGRLVAAAVQTDPTFRVLRRDPLFQVTGNYRFGPAERRYDVSLDDQSFLMIALGSTSIDPEASEFHLILVENWFEELKRLVRN